MGTLGSRLKERRERMNITQLQASKDLGITNVQLCRYESDIHKPDPELLAKVADVYEVSIYYLVTGKEQTTAHLNSEQIQFLHWVERHMENSFFEDFDKSPEDSKSEMMETLKFLWEREKRRRCEYKQVK